MQAAQINCFGEPSIRFGADRIALGGQQPVTLAAIVAAGPEGVTTTQLYHELFGDDPQTSGEQTIIMRLQRLRAKLAEVAGDLPVLTSGRRISVNLEVCSVDVWEFEDAVRNFSEGWQQTLSAWAEPYRGLRVLPDSVLISAERLRKVLRTGLAHVCWTIEHGEPTELIELLTGETREDPFNEALATSLAVALCRTGQQTEALASLADFRSRLLDGHGLNPGSPFDRVELSILNSEIDPVTSPIAAPRRRASLKRLTEPDRFVGRGPILTAIEDELGRLGTKACAQRMIHIISGPAGSGKSTLVAKSLTPLQQDGTAIRLGSARMDGGSSDQTPIYRPFIEAFPELDDYLSTAAAATVGERGQGPIWDRVHQVFEEAASVGPTVVVLEDMHDADSASVALVRFLAGASLDPRLSIVVTTREPTAGSLWQDTVNALVAERDRVVVHTLDPLVLSDLQTLVGMDHPTQDLVLRERFARRLLAVSGGNALIAAALSKSADQNLDLDLLPGSLDPEDTYFSHVTDRISDRELEQILWVAAMIGLEFESNLIGEVLNLDEASVAAHLQRFTSMELGYRVDRYTWRFDHLLTLNSIARTAGLMRPLLLARLARAGTDNPLRMLRYVTGAGVGLPVDFRIEQLRWVAQLLDGQGAYDESSAAWQTLSALLPDASAERLEALISTAGALSRTGRREQATRTRAQAVELARLLGNGEAVFRAALAGLPSGEYVGGESDRLAILMQMTPSERERVPPLDFARWNLRFARLADDPDAARSVIGSIRAHWPGEIEQRASLHLERLSFEAEGQAVRVLREIRDLCDICPDGPQRSEMLHRAVLHALIEQEPLEEVRTSVVAAADHATAYGTPRVQWCSDVLSATLAMVGIAEVAATPATARASGHRRGIPDVEDSHYVQLFMELWLGGNVGLAQPAIDDVRSKLAMNVAWHAGLALSAATNNDRERSQLEIGAVVEALKHRPDGTWAPFAAALLAETAAIRDDRIAAAAARDALQTRSGLALVLGVGSAHFGPVDRYLGLTADVLGNTDAEQLLAASIDQARRTGAKVWEQRAQADLSRLRLGANPLR